MLARSEQRCRINVHVAGIASKPRLARSIPPKLSPCGGQSARSSTVRQTHTVTSSMITAEQAIAGRQPKVSTAQPSGAVAHRPPTMPMARAQSAGCRSRCHEPHIDGDAVFVVLLTIPLAPPGRHPCVHGPVRKNRAIALTPRGDFPCPGSVGAFVKARWLQPLQRLREANERPYPSCLDKKENNDMNASLAQPALCGPPFTAHGNTGRIR